MHAPAPLVIALLSLVVCGGSCASAAAAPTTTRPTHIAVADDASLLAVLRQPAVQHITLTSDVALAHEGVWTDLRPRSLVLRRNVTISSAPGRQHALDLAFLGDGQLALAPSVVLTLSNLALLNARYGAGMQLDLADPASPGAVVVYSSVIFQRAMCVPAVDEPEAVALQPRLTGYPGQQRARYLERFCWRDECRTQVLLYESFTKLSTATADTAAGGYSLVLVNTTKLCDAVADGCAASRSQDECVRRALDAAPTTAPTPGQRAAAEAAAAEAAAGRRAASTTAAAVGASVGAVLLALVLLLLVVRPQLRKRRAAAAQLKAAGGGGAAASGQGSNSHGSGSATALGQQSGSCVAAAAASADAAFATDLEAVFGAPAAALQRSSSSVGTSSVHSGSATKPVVLRSPRAVIDRRAGHHSPSQLADTWAIVAWKTSQRFVGTGPQQQPSDAAMLSRSSTGGSSSSALEWPGRHAALSSYDVMLQGQPAASQHLPLSLDRISLGLLLGAGASGRVFKGKWRGMDVAVKVLQHSQAAAAAVANEVDLMMRFHGQHPNVVSAHHWVTWRKAQSQLQQQHYSLRARLSSGSGAAQEPLLPLAQQQQHLAGCPTSGATTATPLQDNAAAGAPAAPTAAVLELSEQQEAEQADAHDGAQATGDDMQTWIVQEFAECGSLLDYSITQEGQGQQLPTGHAMLRLLFRLRETAAGMAYLHDTAHVVHGDLKASNVLLALQPTAPYGCVAKVADFGLSRVHARDQTHHSTRTLGTISHMAPELLRFGKASQKGDVYSFGVMMWELLHGQRAFRGQQLGFIVEHVALLGERLPCGEGVPEDYRLLMEACWHADPAQRPRFTQVLRCIEIMIASEQQQVAEAATYSSSSHLLTTDGVQGCSSTCGSSCSRPLAAAAAASPTSAATTSAAGAGTGAEASTLSGSYDGSTCQNSGTFNIIKRGGGGLAMRGLG